jgi:hypothetical protein
MEKEAIEDDDPWFVKEDEYFVHNNLPITRYEAMPQ